MDKKIQIVKTKEMREIKFRAWVTATEAVGALPKPWMCVNTMNVLQWFVSGGVTMQLMQCTGLKDRNSKDGYHKDIVKGFGKLWTIEWQKEEARFWLAPSAGNTSSWKYMDELARMEIIGNVYEHPNLVQEPETPSPKP